MARKLIIAGGYESERFLPNSIQQLYSTYAIISEPLIKKDFWHHNTLIWETAQPYLYIRTTIDGRIAVGGKDTKGSDPAIRYRNLPIKKKQLENSFKKLFPRIEFTTDFAWAGSFASTRDGLPYIGCVTKCPNTFFVLGLIRKKQDKDLSLFSFDR